MRTLNPVKHDEKRQEIVAAAARCIARDGFRGASTADICREAGISPGHLYHYFASKEEILTAITEQGLEHIAARFAQMMQSDDAIAALVSELDRHKSKKQPLAHAINMLVLELLVETGRNPAIARIVRKNTVAMRGMLVDFLQNAQLRGQIDPGLDADVTAGLLLSVMDGMKTLTIRDPDADITAHVELLKTLLSRFLSVPKKR